MFFENSIGPAAEYRFAGDYWTRAAGTTRMGSTGRRAKVEGSRSEI